MKDGIVAKLAAQCEELYAESYKICSRENLKQLWDKDWIPTVSFYFETNNICYSFNFYRLVVKLVLSVLLLSFIRV